MEEQYSDAIELARTLGIAALEGKRNERELREAIRAAAPLIGAFQQLLEGRVLPGHDGPLDRLITAWRALPAVQSAIALEAADRGE
jgi:hypothetical protein